MLNFVKNLGKLVFIALALILIIAIFAVFAGYVVTLVLSNVYIFNHGFKLENSSDYILQILTLWLTCKLFLGIAQKIAYKE
jgi:hypothetical protein